MQLAEVETFGAVDADADTLLRECFQDHPAYLEAKEHRKFLVLGRKGSGKTAIFKRLITESRSDGFAYGHTFEDYPWQHHDLQAQAGVPEERRYLHSWKYLLLMSLSKILLNQDSSQPWCEEAQESLGDLEDFVVDSYGSRSPDLTQLFVPSKQLQLKGTLKIPFVEVSGERVLVQELPTHIQEVNAAIERAVLRTLNPNNDYYVCFDQLDLGFSKLDETYPPRLIGLILAARDLVLKSRDAGQRLNVVVFLRDDIYQDLQFEDKNKITESLVTRVEWSEAGSANLTLKQLMERRFQEALDEVDPVSWERVFDEGKEMPSRQTKYRHICERTFLRPRDIIKFCNEVLKVHQLAGAQASVFGNEHVHEARDAYSEYLLRELDDEIAKHVPDYREYLEVLKVLGSVEFSLEQFETAWSGRSALAAREAASGLAELFDFSVVGYLKPGGRGGGSKYVWRYKDSRARFNATAETYRVHPGFKEALDLTFGLASDGRRDWHA